jgi:hypothetical protein
MNVSSDASGLTYKRAETADERRRLHHEAGVLRRAAHPGIVQLVGTEGADPPLALVLRTVPGGDLTRLEAQPVAVIAGLGAALATTVGDLHALGFSHGAIEAAHVLLDEGGRPVLCSLARAERSVTCSSGERHRADDVQALARMLLGFLGAAPPARVTRILQGVARTDRRRRAHDARWLARQLTAAVPDARLPSGRGVATAGAEMCDEPRRATVSGRPAAVPSRRRLVVLAFGVCVVVVSAALLLPQVLTPHRAPVDPVPFRLPIRASSPSVVACPPVDDGCGPVAAPGGIVATSQGRYQMGGSGDVIVLGRWHCGPAALPAVLRPSTGEVWTFDSWPAAGRAVVGTLATRVTSAWSLRVGPQPSGCDRLLIDRRGLPPLAMFGTGS